MTAGQKAGVEMSEEIKLELRNISKSFPGVKALDQVSFRLKKGTTHVLCGENGAGKSTLMKILDGIYRQDEGEIYIDGRPVQIKSPVDARANGIAMIFQELSYVPDLTVAENVYLEMCIRDRCTTKPLVRCLTIPVKAMV